MRLNTNVPVEQDFAKWQLEVGQGKHTDEESNISLPEHFKCQENSVDSLIHTIYPGIYAPNHPPQYFSERTILSCKNNDVDALNQTVLDMFPGDKHVFQSADFIPTAEQSGEDDATLNYPVVTGFQGSEPWPCGLATDWSKFRKPAHVCTKRQKIPRASLEG